MDSRLKISVVMSLTLFFSGLAAATAVSVNLDDNNVQSGINVSISVTADQSTDNVYAILDNNSNGVYDSSTDLIESGSINNSDISETIGYFNETSSFTSGIYNVYAVQQGSAPADGETVSGQASTQLEFDNTAPSISNFAVNKLNFYSVNVSFESDEVLEDVIVEKEPNLETTSIEEFSKDSSSPPILYWSVIEVDSGGDLQFKLASAEDAAENNGANSENTSVSLDPIINDLIVRSENNLPVLEIISYDQLSSINASLGGNSSGFLTRTDFSENYDSGNDEYAYLANMSSENDGYFNATLLEATNGTGDDGAWGQFDEDSFQTPPSVEGFYLSNSGQDVTLNVEANEKLSMINGSFGGTVSSGDLDYSNFTESTNNGFYNYTVDLPSGQDGTYNATLDFMEDDSGNRNSNEFTDEIVLDSTAPTISSYTVANPNSNQVNVSFDSSEELSTITAIGSGIESFTLDENDFSTSQSSAPYTYFATYNVSNEGSLTVDLTEASDISGNDGSSGNSLSITVEYPPTIHEFDLFANSQDVDLKVNVSEQLNNLTVDLSRDVSGTLYISDFVESNPSPYYIYTADVSSGTQGEFEATLQSTEDSQSLDGSSGESDVLFLDNNPPPNPNTTVIDEPRINDDNDETVTVEVNFTSSTETGDLEVRFNNSNGDSLKINKSVGSTDQLQTFTFNLSELSDGEVWADSRMFDEAGNMNNEGFTANSSSVTKDTEVPDVKDSITGDSFNGGSAASDKITIDFTDLSGLDVSSVQNNDFTVKVSNQERPIQSLTIDNGRVTITLENDLPTGVTPNVDVVNIADNFGNEITTIKTLNTRDGLSPQIVSAVVDSSASTSTQTFIEINFTEGVNTDADSLTIDGKTVNFQTDGSNTDKHTVNYGEILGTGSSPEITSVTNVADTEGNDAVIKDGSVVVNSFQRTLSQGKNLVSFPIEDKSTYPVSELLPENKIKAVWSYSNGAWQVYNPGASDNDFNQIKGGYGYIVYAKEDFSIAPNVNTVSSGEVAEYPVNDGWNLVAHSQEYDQAAEAGGAFDSGLTVEEVRKKSPDSFDYVRIDTGASLPEDMEPGSAYWLKSGEGNTVLTPNFASSQSDIVINAVRGLVDLVQGMFSFLTEVVG